MPAPRLSPHGDHLAGVHAGQVVTLEGMPGAGKTTLATTLSRRGHLVVAEYAAVDGSVIGLKDHPAVEADDAHQRNWLRKHQLAEVLATTSRGGAVRCGAMPVWMDRDWVTALAYAYSLEDRELLASRAGWATRNLAAGRLAVASAYLVLHLDPAESLHRRAGQLDQAHPWSRLGPLSRLADFYRDPAEAISTEDPGLASSLTDAAWIHIDAPTPRRAVAAAAALLRNQLTERQPAVSSSSR